MKILIAPDKFKGGQTAREVASNIAAGMGEVLPEAVIEIVAAADGGDGTAAVLCDALGGEWRECQACDALGRPINARYVWLPSRRTAVIEMSEAAGLKGVPREERDIDRATTLGVGQMMLHAAQHDAREMIIGLGGSATNDAGFGMARALGFRFRDERGGELGQRTGDLRTLAHIEAPGGFEMRGVVKVVAAVDVQNPLLGPNGATRVYGPQKGASPEQIPLLEAALEHMAKVVRQDLGVDHRSTPGAGAAGGLGFGLMSFAGATVRSGFEVVSQAIGLEDKMRAADIVVTGEGRLDLQTLDGKAPAEVARMARRLGKRVFAVVACSDHDARLTELFDGIYEVADPACTEAENIAQAPRLLREGGRRLATDLR